MQDKIILGMLSLHPMSVYELKKNMDKSTSMFYNTSIGSIHPACQKLHATGLVSCKKDESDKRGKKIFSITPEGNIFYKDWLKSPLGIGKIKDELLLRLFFFSDSDDEWKSVLTQYLQEVRDLRESLGKQKTDIDAESIPAEYKRVAHFQLATLDFGYDYYCFLEDWIERFLKKTIPQ